MKSNTKSPAVISKALHDMVSEVKAMKVKANAFLEELDSTSPESLLDGASEFEAEAPMPGEGGDDEAPEFGEEGGEGEKEKGPEIKDVGDAKKVLDEAKSDLEAVIDSLDEVAGEGESAEKEAKLKRFNDRYASSLDTLRSKAEKSITDANDALKHWGFLLKMRKPSVDIKDSSLKQAMNTLEDVNKFWSFASKLFGRKVEATAVPPTGAEFSGDKWPEGKDPKMVEERAWKRGAEKFHGDRKFEDARPNPAVDHRLDTTEYNRDEKPFVNATFKFNQKSPYDSYWEVTDTKNGRQVRASFISAPDRLGKKNRQGLSAFGHQEYGQKIVGNVILQEMKKDAGKSKVGGIDFIVSELNAEEVDLQKTAKKAEAKDPNIKDKAKVRRYFAEAYGDSEYARELTSTEKKTKLNKKSGEEGGSSPAMDKMDVEYSPKDEHPESTNTGQDEPGEAKDGPNPMSSKKQDPQVLKARVAKAVEAARVYASRGVIAFTKEAIFAKAKELLQLSDSEFGIKKATIEELPIKNEAALKSAHIPDTEKGIVGNPSEGVSDPGATVKTEGMKDSTKSDAKAKQSKKVVPQMQVTAANNSAPAIPFSTLEHKLGKKGIDPKSLNLRTPRYRR